MWGPCFRFVFWPFPQDLSDAWWWVYHLSSSLSKSYIEINATVSYHDRLTLSKLYDFQLPSCHLGHAFKSTTILGDFSQVDTHVLRVFHSLVPHTLCSRVKVIGSTFSSLKPQLLTLIQFFSGSIINFSSSTLFMPHSSSPQILFLDYYTTVLILARLPFSLARPHSFFVVV